MSKLFEAVDNLDKYTLQEDEDVKKDSLMLCYGSEEETAVIPASDIEFFHVVFPVNDNKCYGHIIIKLDYIFLGDKINLGYLLENNYIRSIVVNFEDSSMDAYDIEWSDLRCSPLEEVKDSYSILFGGEIIEKKNDIPREI